MQELSLSFSETTRGNSNEFKVYSNFYLVGRSPSHQNKFSKKKWEKQTHSKLFSCLVILVEKLRAAQAIKFLSPLFIAISPYLSKYQAWNRGFTLCSIYYLTWKSLPIFGKRWKKCL